MFLKPLIGGLSILIISCCGWDICSAQQSCIKISDLESLGNKLSDDGDVFAAYVFRLAYYHLSADSSTKLNAGVSVVKLCLDSERSVEAQRMIHRILEDFPKDESLRKHLMYQLAYSNLISHDYGKADHELRRLQSEPKYKDRVLFIRAYLWLLADRPKESVSMLRDVNLNSFRYADSVRCITAAIEQGPSYRKRHKAIAVVLSACVPGLGQAYSDHYFDAIESAGFNFVLGGVCYLSWKYEVFDKNSNSKSYTLPLFTSLAWSVFYVSNIWSAANATNRYNRYRDLKYNKSILERFSVVLTDKEYFLSVNF